MTNKELRQLFYLNREIKSLNERLSVLESLAEKTTVTPAPYIAESGNKDLVGRYAVEIAAIRAQIEAMKIRCVTEQERLNSYINSIDDSLIRQIMTYRHICGLSWERVADEIGGGITGESCRNAHWRFLKNK